MTSYLAEDASLIRSELPEGANPPAGGLRYGLFVLYAVLMRAKGERSRYPQTYTTLGLPGP